MRKKLFCLKMIEVLDDVGCLHAHCSLSLPLKSPVLAEELERIGESLITMGSRRRGVSVDWPH